MAVDIFKTVGDSFSALLNNKTLLVIALINAIILGLVTVFAIVGALSAGVPSRAALAPYLGALAVLAIVIIFVEAFLVGAGISAVGEKNSLRKAFARAARKYTSLLGASILVSIITLVGFVLLIIPGIYLAVRLSLTQPSVILEDRSAVDSMKRSWQLTSGNWWPVFWVTIIISAIVIVIRLIFALVPIVGGLVEGFLEYAFIAAYVLIFQQLGGRMMAKKAAPSGAPQKKRGSKKR